MISLLPALFPLALKQGLWLVYRFSIELGEMTWTTY